MGDPLPCSGYVMSDACCVWEKSLTSGPSFTHPRIPVRAHYLGTYTPLTCPDEYIAAVRHLIEEYKFEVQYSYSAPSSFSTSQRKQSGVVPLVINTQGWVKGLGEDLLKAIEGAAAPTHVFALDSPASMGYEEEIPGQTFSPIYQPSALPPLSGAGVANGSAAPQLHVLEPAPVSPLQARYTSADMRILSTIAYFHSSLTMKGPVESKVTWDFSTPLGGMVPLQVDLGPGPESPLKAVYLIGEGAESILTSDLPLTLNGAIVALARVDPLVLDRDDAGQGVYVQGRTLPSGDDINVLGLAVIRGVRTNLPDETIDQDPSSASTPSYTLRLLTPLPSAGLGQVNAMIKNGAIELPLCGILDWRAQIQNAEEKTFGVDIDNVPFLERPGGGGVGRERRKVRRNIMRKGV